MRIFSSKAYALLLIVVSSCSQEKSSLNNAITSCKRVDLEVASICVPVVWKTLDYKTLKLLPAGQGKRYCFLDSGSNDKIFRENVIVTVVQREGGASFAKAGEMLIKNLEEDLDQVRMISFKDTVIKNSELTIAEVSFKNNEQNVKAIGTFAFYKSGKILINVVGSALDKPGIENQKNRALFKQIIYSIRMK